MWKRKDLKKKAKKNFLKNYWAAVGICFILAFIGIEYSDSVSLIHKTSDNVDNYTIVTNIGNENTESQEELNGDIDKIKIVVSDGFESVTSSFSWVFKMFAGGYFILGAIVMLLFIFFAAYPISVGAKRFFVKNQDTKAGVLEIFNIFRGKEYINVVFVMFCKYVFNLFWTLLLIVPGIIKYYQLRMVPYILSENPDIKRKRAFEISKTMMKGQKWKSFVLDLSFFLWYLLSSFTCGLLGIFFVNPYNAGTLAELYTVLKNKAIEENNIKKGELAIAPFKEEEVEA